MRLGLEGKALETIIWTKAWVGAGHLGSTDPHPAFCVPPVYKPGTASSHEEQGGPGDRARPNIVEDPGSSGKNKQGSEFPEPG